MNGIPQAVSDLAAAIPQAGMRCHKPKDVPTKAKKGEPEAKNPLSEKISEQRYGLEETELF